MRFVWINGILFLYAVSEGHKGHMGGWVWSLQSCSVFTHQQLLFSGMGEGAGHTSMDRIPPPCPPPPSCSCHYGGDWGQ